MKIHLIFSALLTFAVGSAAVYDVNHEQHGVNSTNTGVCSNGAQISAFPRHMPFARHGMYFSSWRLRTYYGNANYPGGGKDWKDTPIVIRVVDRNGDPAPGCRVTWRTGRGQSNGWVMPMETLTAGDGTVRASWIAGSSNRQAIVAGIEHQDGSEASATITGSAGGERVLAPAPSYRFDYGEDWSEAEFDVKALHWGCDGGSVFHTIGSQHGYYTGPQCNGVLFTTWWKSPEEKTEIVAPPESIFETGGNRPEFKNSTHHCFQCLDCAEGYHASCYLKIPPEVGVVYRLTVTKKFNSWDPDSDMTSYKDVGVCGPRGDDARADLSNCTEGEVKVAQFVKGIDGSIVSTIGGCDYLSYTIYSCSNGFNPTSTLTTYLDQGSCGPRGDDAQADLTQCTNGYTIVEKKPNVEWKVVATINGCKYFSYTIYKCRENKVYQNTDIAVYFQTVPSSLSVSRNRMLSKTLPKILIGEMRYLDNKRGHSAGGFLESPSGVQYSCLDTPLMEVVHAGGRWRGDSGDWHNTDLSMFSFENNRQNCANAWAGKRDDGIHISAGGKVVGASSTLLDNSCINGIKDGDEYDTDCGGGCVPCNFEMKSCDDGIMNGDEEYVDCGGSCHVSCLEKGNVESYFKITSSKDNGGEPFTWDKAAELCLAKNSALAIISSTEQNIAVTTLCGRNIKCWIGLYRKDSCAGPSCLKWTPREDGSIFYLDQTIFNHWGCWGGGGETGCYFQYKDKYTRYYMYTENHGIMPTNAWFAAKESTQATVAICGTPPLSFFMPSPHMFWRVRSDEPWLLDLYFVPFFDSDCQTPVLIGEPISYSTSVTSVMSGSSKHIMIHFHDPTPIGCFRLDSADSYSKDSGVPIMESVGNGIVFLEFSDDGITWLKAPNPLDDLLSESDARPFNLFDPASTLTTYLDQGSCGPRGDDAKADLTQCTNGYTIEEQKPNVGYKVVAEINGCKYFSYTIYQCNPLSPSLSLSDSPSITPTESDSCIEGDTDIFLLKYNKKNKPIKKSCGWLSAEKKKQKYCRNKVDYDSSTEVVLNPPQDVCKKTCNSCDPCYENARSKFIFSLPNACIDVNIKFAINKKGKPKKTCKQWKKKNKCSNGTVAEKCCLTCEVEPIVLHTCGWLAGRDNVKEVCEKTDFHGGYGPPRLHCPKTCVQGSCSI